MPEARLQDGVPVTDGWFVVNAGETRWLHDEKQSEASFEGEAAFAHVGISLYRLAPGQPMSLYHEEVIQEDFLVLRGTATLVIQGQTRPLQRWDFIHCPPGTAHTIVAGPSEPALILAVGQRDGLAPARYPVEPAAIALGAGVPDAATSAREIYATWGSAQPGPPPPELRG